MRFSSGQKLGNDEILDAIGVGGMGEVYRARDSELEREVAIKVLPAAFADDEERVARLEREARLLASLNHPHIAAIYSLEAVEGNRFLVLEVVEGETLQERIARGPLPLDEAIEVSRQIAEALDAAHGKGVIHRNNAARRKSRLMRALHSQQAATNEEKPKQDSRAASGSKTKAPKADKES